MGFVGNCLYVIFLSAAVHGLGNTDQCSGPYVSFTINDDADVKFTVILSLRTTTPDQKCSSEWSDTAIQTVGAIQWAVDRINNASFIDGVKLGKRTKRPWRKSRSALSSKIPRPTDLKPH